MRVLSFVLFILFVIAPPVIAQDIIYTTGGNKLQAKVLEINPTNIKYKDHSNLEGPTYVIIKTDVVLIKYSNGITEVINSNPATLGPKTENTVVNSSKPSESTNNAAKQKTVEKPPFNLYYLNNNMLSINALALANGDVTLMYDRDLLDSKVSLTFLGGYSFNSRMGGLNGFIADSKDNAKKKYDLGFGVNFMPRNTKRVQYFIGLLGKYMSYDYQNVIDTTNNQKQYEKASAYQMAVMLSNGWVFRVSPNFNFKLFGAIGAPINSVALKPEYIGVPKVYLGYCFGYRF
ncbi:MAG: hypothetical protein K0S26_1296 [Bacteroidota bacterium]|jgi:hypothetical protein|nr:hypothetical protein [Bacteroidota bacterium]